MAIRRPIRKIKNDEPPKYCDDCAFSEWITEHWNKDFVTGAPICLKCKFEPFAIIRGRKACNKWKVKTPNL